VWKNSRQSAGRVGERERERKREREREREKERERERERDPEPASGSSTPQHLTIFLSNDLVVCRAAYAAVVVVEEK
jgi:hypothetical protein